MGQGLPSLVDIFAPENVLGWVVPPYRPPPVFCVSIHRDRGIQVSRYPSMYPGILSALRPPRSRLVHLAHLAHLAHLPTHTTHCKINVLFAFACSYAHPSKDRATRRGYVYLSYLLYESLEPPNTLQPRPCPRSSASPKDVASLLILTHYYCYLYCYRHCCIS